MFTLSKKFPSRDTVDSLNSLSYLRAGLEGGGLEKRGSRDCLARQLCLGQEKIIIS
jgi:hypothetical protein